MSTECKYCQKDFESIYQWEDHMLYACPEKCKNYEETIRKYKNALKLIKRKVEMFHESNWSYSVLYDVSKICQKTLKLDLIRISND